MSVRYHRMKRFGRLRQPSRVYRYTHPLTHKFVCMHSRPRCTENRSAIVEQLNSVKQED